MYIQSFYPLMLGGSRQHLYCWAMSTGFLPAKGQGTSSKFYHSSFCCFCCSVTKSDSLQFHGLQHVRLPCPSLSPWVSSNSCPLSQGWHLTVSSHHPLLLLPSIFPGIRGLFQWVSSSHQVAKGLYGGTLVAKSCSTLAIPWTVAHQAPLSVGFSR